MAGRKHVKELVDSLDHWLQLLDVHRTTSPSACSLLDQARSLAELADKGDHFAHCRRLLNLLIAHRVLQLLDG